MHNYELFICESSGHEFFHHKALKRFRYTSISNQSSKCVVFLLGELRNLCTTFTICCVNQHSTEYRTHVIRASTDVVLD